MNEFLLSHPEACQRSQRYARLSPQAMLEAVNVVGNVVGRRPVVASQGPTSVALA